MKVNPTQQVILDGIKAHYRGTRFFSDLYGPANLQTRRRILAHISKGPEKAAWNKFKSHILDALGIRGTCAADAEAQANAMIAEYTEAK